MLMAPQVSAQSTVQTVKKSSKGLFEIFSTEMPEGTTWGQEGKYVRSGGYSKNTPNYIYVSASKSPAQMNGLSIPIRENPKAGEYRYISFAFVKWGGNQVGIHLQATPQAGNSKGEKYDFTYIAGDGKPKNEQKANASKKKNDTSEQLITKGLSIDTEAPSGWMVVTRDLWKDFGDFTLTGIDFLCPQRRDAGFDEIFLARSQDDLANAPKVSPSEIATPLPLDDEGNEMTLDDLNEEDETEEQPQGVQIDWAAQIKAGGLMMYPLYALGIIAFVIALQRIFTSRAARLAPKPLCKAIDNCISQKDLQGAIDACHKYPSTLASALSYILEHINAGREAVSQTAGDIAARDIRTHLSRIYPISVISSLSPLIGLLGTVVGMIEAFGLVALYGDEGGPSILSDSISKALITTAAGLIIAVPAIALYFLIKNRIQRLASTIEVEIEKVITQIYLEKNSPLNEGKDAERTEIKEDNL
ncbi:MAG: MotA/TolQ/ExbB proton channel family protein [Bacteroides sp.]|nr:MotA/TolQ/ExbB proton channel family protein [Bacteroides sp.]